MSRSIAVGQVFTLGRHRLMCGDAGNPEHVAALMGDVRPDLVFTSPPYAQQRRYVSGIGDWDTLMQRVFGAMPHHQKTQVLVNLGLVHVAGEVQPYWEPWIQWMQARAWRRLGWYVWDKLSGAPGVFGGRPAPSFEFLFHFSRTKTTTINRTMPCKTAGARSTGGGNKRTGSGKKRQRVVYGKAEVQAFKIPDATFRLRPAANGHGHPAVFPIELPAEIIRAYTDPGDVVYEPFAGSGTTILASEREGRTCCAMEIEPSYCAIAVDRYRKSCANPTLPGAA